MIEVSELYKFYGTRRAVGPLSFTIGSGEIVGLLGLNGAGKTTTLRVLACDLLPSTGRVTIGGFDVVATPHEVRRRIGYLPDRPPLYDEMSVRDFLAFCARLRGVPSDRAEKQALTAAEKTQLAGVLDQTIGTLSHGFRQRVGIAQAIVHEPALLVLDEPISGLDPVQIVEMRELLKGLKGAHTIVLSSHILSEISETCDRLLVIRDGAIGAVGTQAELSRSLLAGTRAELTVRASKATISSALGGLPDVSNVDISASDFGEDVLRVTLECPRDVREDACRLLVGAGAGILEVKRAEHELENLFLSLAGKGERGATSATPSSSTAEAN